MMAMLLAHEQPLTKSTERVSLTPSLKPYKCCAGLSDASLLTSLVHAKGSLRWFMLKLVPSPSFDFFAYFFLFLCFLQYFSKAGTKITMEAGTQHDWN